LNGSREHNDGRKKKIRTESELHRHQLTRAPLWTKVPEYDNSLLALFDGTGLYSFDKVIFGIKNPGFARKSKAFFSSNFGNCSTRREITFENPVSHE